MLFMQENAISAFEMSVAADAASLGKLEGTIEEGKEGAKEKTVSSKIVAGKQKERDIEK